MTDHLSLQQVRCLFQELVIRANCGRETVDMIHDLGPKRSSVNSLAAEIDQMSAIIEVLKRGAVDAIENFEKPTARQDVYDDDQSDRIYTPAERSLLWRGGTPKPPN